MANQAAWSFLKTSALAWADEVSANSLWNIMPFLLIVWKLNFSHAAVIVSVMAGCIKIMPMPMQFLMDTFLGHYGMLSISSVCLSIGWSFLAMSTSSMFLKLPLSSCENGPFCVGEFQWVLLYASLALITLGITGHSISLQEFTKQQLSGIEDAEQLVRDEPQLLGAGFMTVFVRFFCSFVLPFIWPWGARFAIPAICAVAATFLFFRGSGGYIRVEQPKSPILRVVRVVVASCLKVRVHVPKDPRELYEKNENGNEEVLPHTNRLRFLDKAATLSRSQAIEEQQNREWRLCRVTEVEETKIFFLMIPVWMSFIVLGLVLAVGNFYFIAQAFNMNPRFMFLTIQFLMFLRDFSKSLSTNIFLFLANMANIFGVLKQKHIPATGMAVGMFVSILCVIVAALVESMRLSRGPVSTTVFWLIPQFLVLGTVHGIVDHSALLFAVTQAPDLMKSSMALISEGVFGVGYIVSGVLTVCMAGRGSAEIGSHSWFGESINKSRLDEYYWALAALSLVNLLFYGLVAYWFDYKEVSSTREEPQQEVDEEMLHHHDE